jgi:hypothetical protein
VVRSPPLLRTSNVVRVSLLQGYKGFGWADTLVIAEGL